MWWYDGGWGAWLAMTLGMVVFWGFVIWAILALVRTGADVGRPAHRRPEEILAQRFARGEIDENEYRRRVEVLRTAQSSSSIGTGRDEAARDLLDDAELIEDHIEDHGVRPV